MTRSKDLAVEATSVSSSGKEFALYDVQRFTVKPFDLTYDIVTTLRMNPQKRSLKAILLLFVEKYTMGARDIKKVLNPDITMMSVTNNG